MRHLRLPLVLTLVALLSWTSISPAAAHALLDRAEPVGDGSTNLVFTFDHSCADSPTVEMTIDLPEGSELLSGTGPDGWSATTEGSRIVFAGPGIGDRQDPEFSVVARLTGSIGQTLLFPTEQTCANGDGYLWDAESEAEDRPAPRLVATEAVLAEVDTPGATAPTLPDDGASLMQVAIALGILAAIVYGSSQVLLRRGR